MEAGKFLTIEGLLKNARQSLTVAPVGDDRRPDSLVLVVGNYCCNGCGYTAVVPSSKILVRYGNNTSLVRHWRDSWNTLPREIKHVDVDLLTCQQCFDTKLFAKIEVDTRK